MDNEPDETKPEQTPGNRPRIPAGRVNTDEQDDGDVAASTYVGKFKVSFRVIREVMASPSVGPYLKYPIMAIAVSIVIIATGLVCSWVLK